MQAFVRFMLSIKVLKSSHITHTEKIYLPGHNKVSSLKEATVSRDDSIVVALPSNILPENKKNFYSSSSL